MEAHANVCRSQGRESAHLVVGCEVLGLRVHLTLQAGHAILVLTREFAWLPILAGHDIVGVSCRVLVLLEVAGGFDSDPSARHHPHPFVHATRSQRGPAALLVEFSSSSCLQLGKKVSAPSGNFMRARSLVGRKRGCSRKPVYRLRRYALKMHALRRTTTAEAEGLMTH
jgi:hypothetical protein